MAQLQQAMQHRIAAQRASSQLCLSARQLSRGGSVRPRAAATDDNSLTTTISGSTQQVTTTGRVCVIIIVCCRQEALVWPYALLVFAT